MRSRRDSDRSRARCGCERRSPSGPSCPRARTEGLVSSRSRSDRPTRMPPYLRKPAHRRRRQREGHHGVPWPCLDPDDLRSLRRSDAGERRRGRRLGQRISRARAQRRPRRVARLRVPLKAPRLCFADQPAQASSKYSFAPRISAPATAGVSFLSSRATRRRRTVPLVRPLVAQSRRDHY